MKTINLNGYTFYLDNIVISGGSKPNLNADSDWDYYGESPEVSYDVIDVISAYGWMNEDCEYITPTDADKNEVVLEMEDEIAQIILSDMQDEV